MPRCLMSTRFTMLCDILKPAGAPTVTDSNEPSGSYKLIQNPDSFAIERKWIPDNPATPQDDSYEGKTVLDVPCLARGITNTGLQGAGTTEKFSELYQNLDWIRLTVSSHIFITKRDRVTNIRSKKTKDVIWKEEEIDDFPPTIFDVMGVVPSFDPFGRVIDLGVLLQRSEVQDASY